MAYQPRGGGRDTVGQIMGSFKRGQLRSGSPQKYGRDVVAARDQAIAIALKEAELSNKPKKQPYLPRERFPRGPR
jgi:hypothetical protein